MALFRKSRLAILLVAAGIAVSFAAPLSARSPRPVDCPLRDAPFSIDSPLIDLLLSEAALAVIDRHAPGLRAKIPPFLSGTKAPTFSAILTWRSLAGIIPAEKPVDLAALDAALRALPVSENDRRARCARYDDERPSLVTTAGRPRVLLFEKMTGFRDTPSVLAANAAVRTLAERNGWSLAVTDKGGAMHPSVLAKFDVVIWNNVSGDVLTLSQRKAFRGFVEGGGGFVGIHGSAGDPVYFWDWYPDTLIGARFIGHPSDPQFQDAEIRLEPSASGIGSDMGSGWTMNDEWYSFAQSPRATGSDIVATLNEDSYKPGVNRFGQRSLAMGKDHPIAWTRCVGKGRAFYSAIGHRPETYADPNHLKLLEQAVVWAAAAGTRSCRTKVGRP